MRVGLSLDRFAWPEAVTLGPTLVDIARRAEAAGVASVWVMDHFLQIPLFGSPGDPMPEAYTTLAYLAGATDRLEFGTLTTGASFRPPGILLKIVSSLDALSCGRVWLGVGGQARCHGLEVDEVLA